MAAGGKYKPLVVMLPGPPVSPPETLHDTLTGEPSLEVAVNCKELLVEIVDVPGAILKTPFDGPLGPSELALPQPASTSKNAIDNAARWLERSICNFTSGGEHVVCRRT
jgi:hypothetical protein